MTQQHDHITDITTAEFPQAVLQRSHEVPVVVDFWAEWCGPCRMISPILGNLASAYAGRLKVVKVDVDRWPRLGARHRAQSIPLLVLFRDGAEVDRVIGAHPEHHLDAVIQAAL